MEWDDLKPFLIFMMVGVPFQAVVEITTIGIRHPTEPTVKLGYLMAYPHEILFWLSHGAVMIGSCVVIYYICRKWRIWLPVTTITCYIILAVANLDNPAFFTIHRLFGSNAQFITINGLTRIFVDRVMGEEMPKWALRFVIAISLIFFGLHLGMYAGALVWEVLENIIG
jgi:hypothetical protein